MWKKILGDLANREMPLKKETNVKNKSATIDTCEDKLRSRANRNNSFQEDAFLALIKPTKKKTPSFCRMEQPHYHVCRMTSEISKAVTKQTTQTVCQKRGFSSMFEETQDGGHDTVNASVNSLMEKTNSQIHSTERVLESKSSDKQCSYNLRKRPDKQNLVQVRKSNFSAVREPRKAKPYHLSKNATGNSQYNLRQRKYMVQVRKSNFSAVREPRKVKPYYSGKNATGNSQYNLRQRKHSDTSENIHVEPKWELVQRKDVCVTIEKLDISKLCPIQKDIASTGPCNGHEQNKVQNVSLARTPHLKEVENSQRPGRMVSEKCPAATSIPFIKCNSVEGNERMRTSSNKELKFEAAGSDVHGSKQNIQFQSRSKASSKTLRSLKQTRKMLEKLADNLKPFIYNPVKSAEKGYFRDLLSPNILEPPTPSVGEPSPVPMLKPTGVTPKCSFAFSPSVFCQNSAMAGQLYYRSKRWFNEADKARKKLNMSHLSTDGKTKNFDHNLSVNSQYIKKTLSILDNARSGCTDDTSEDEADYYFDEQDE